jgi:defect in organelle trafficking protein DotC
LLLACSALSAARAQTIGVGVYPVYPVGVYPYGGGSPYTNNSLNPITNPQSNQSNTQQSQQQQGLQSMLGGGSSSNSSGGSSSGGGSGSGGDSGGGGGGGTSNGDSGADNSSHAIMQNPNSPLYGRYEPNANGARPLRPQVLSQIARGNGIRRGFIEECDRIATSLLANDAAELDQRYDFSRQMIGPHLVPPVIGEVHDVRERSGDRLLYLTVGAYQIERPARLVIKPPTWRDYLIVNAADPKTSISALQPQNFDEQSVYDQAYQTGLAKGVEEARDAFQDNLNRLDRDYRGMERYHELARQGAVSLPVVQDSRTGVRLAEGGNRAFIGEQVVALKVSPKFKATHPGAFQ